MKKILLLIIAPLVFSCALLEEEQVPFTASSNLYTLVYENSISSIFYDDFPFSGTILSIDSVEIEIGQVINSSGFGGDSVSIDLFMTHGDDTILVAEDYPVTSGESVKFTSSEVAGSSFSNFNGNSTREYLTVYVTNNSSISQVSITSFKLKGKSSN